MSMIPSDWWSSKVTVVVTCSGKGLLWRHWSYVLMSVLLTGVLDPSAGLVIPQPANLTRTESLSLIRIGISNCEKD